MTTLEWITDRLPTAADADDDGEVRIRYRPDRRPDTDWMYQHYSLVVPGQPWWSPNVAASTAPELATGPDDRIAALEQRVAKLESMFQDHTHPATVHFFNDVRTGPPIPRSES